MQIAAHEFQRDGYTHSKRNYKLHSVNFQIVTDSKKKVLNRKKFTINKNPQFLPNLNETRSKLPTHELVILTKFH